jgi:Ca2+:H+ antiporter
VNGTRRRKCSSADVSSIECITAVNVSVKDQLTLSISVAIGSALVCHSLLVSTDAYAHLANGAFLYSVRRTASLRHLQADIYIRCLVILAWIINKPLSLLMDPFQSLVSKLRYISIRLFMSIFRFYICLVRFGIAHRYITSKHIHLVQTAGYVIADGKSNWLEGMMLICKRPSDTVKSHVLI